MSRDRLRCDGRVVWGVAFLASAVFLSAGCTGPQLTKDPVDLAPGKCTPRHDPIVVDGKRTTEAEWAEGRLVRLADDKIAARFMWDDGGIYGFLNSNTPLATEPGVSICVAITSGSGGQYRYAFLYFSRAPFGGKVELARAVSGRGSGSAPLDAALFRVASTRMSSFDKLAMWWPWSTEFFVSWRALGRLAGAPDKVLVHVFRVLPERPSALLKLN